MYYAFLQCDFLVERRHEGMGPSFKDCVLQNANKVLFLRSRVRIAEPEHSVVEGGS